VTTDQPEPGKDWTDELGTLFTGEDFAPLVPVRLVQTTLVVRDSPGRPPELRRG
jgi:hypothetical protein